MNQEFFDAATFGELETVKRMLAKNPELVNERDEFEFTALHSVVGEHSLEMAQFLIQSGADTNAKNQDGVVPLHLAAYDYMVEALVEGGADIDTKDDYGSTPLHTATDEGEFDVVKALVKHGAKVNEINNYDNTPLDIAISHEDDEKINLLRKHGGKLASEL